MVIGEDEKGRALVKVHNTIKKGDEIELIMPKYEVLNFKLGKFFDSKIKKAENEAHGGQNKTIIINLKKKAPKFSVLRRAVN